MRIDRLDETFERIPRDSSIYFQNLLFAGRRIRKGRGGDGGTLKKSLWTSLVSLLLYKIAHVKDITGMFLKSQYVTV